MNIDSLRYFQLMAKEGSISSIAKQVHLSQSALSQQIQKLEIDLSRKLMIRSNKGITLTDSGKIVLKFTDNILRMYDEMLSEINQSQDNNLIIKIEACVWIAGYALPCTLINANKKYPNHNYELSGNGSDEILQNISNDICDIGFYCSENTTLSHKDLVVSTAGESNVVLCAKNTAAFPDEMTVEELVSAQLIMCSENNSITQALLSNLKRHGYKKDSLNCSMRVREIESAKKLVTNGYGISFLPYIAIKEELYNKHYKIIKVPDFDIKVNILLVRKPDAPSYVQDFVYWFNRYGRDSFC